MRKWSQAAAWPPAPGCLSGANVEIVLITTSDLDISLLIRQQDEDAALEALHKAFAV